MCIRDRSAIAQKADSITQTVTQRITGGNNIIAGTDDWNNASVDAGGNDLSRKGSYTIDGESVHATNRAQNTRFHFGAAKMCIRDRRGGEFLCLRAFVEYYGTGIPSQFRFSEFYC